MTKRPDVSLGPVVLSRIGSLAVVTIDNPPVNALSRTVRRGLLAALAAIEDDPTVSAGIVRCAGRTFVAGADITELDAPPTEPFLPDVLSYIERSPIFWVAALHGTVLGGGLELALACNARVAQEGTKLGLPEVSLGIIPGAGGTVRLTHLIGGEAASDMVTSGKPIAADRALALGLVDAVTGNAFDAATEIASAGRQDFPPRPVPLPPEPGFWIAASDTIRARSRGQQSPLEALEAVRDAATMPRDEAMRRERERFLRLRSSEQAAALRHMFFAERRAGRSLKSLAAAPDPVDVGVVGGGTMGAGIATAFLLSGSAVMLLERDEASIDRARSLVRENIGASARRGLVEDIDGALARLATTTRWSDFADNRLIVEAVFENMDVKLEVFRSLDDVVRGDAVLATNTSYLDVGAIAAATRNPERVVGLHFFAPAHVMKLLEVVRAPTTGDPALATAAAVARRLGKIAVVSGVCDGFIGNRIMAACRRAAEETLLQGAAPHDVDMAMRGYGFAAGIFETQDMSGLDIAWAMRKRRRLESKEPHARSIGDAMCEAGRFGRKTSAGWYDYVDGKPVFSADAASIIDAFRGGKSLHRSANSAEVILKRILNAMRREAQAVLDEGIAESADDIDVVMVNGFGFPRFRGGPMFSDRSSPDAVVGP
jgi:3-hydroxyacyl-CoA dehydrogenase